MMSFMTKTTSQRIEYWMIFQKDSLLLDHNDQVLTSSTISGIKDYFLRQHHIIELEDSDIYCAELNEEVELPSIVKSVSFKKALGVIRHDWYGIATKAYTILRWDKLHQYCGNCGERTSHRAGTVERVCTACGHLFYPRISPSIIVLIQKDNQILMARSPHFPPGVFGLIAGFVEAGESIEEAVHREVKEETNITIKNLRYFGSQPWPFPDSLMVGFFADYESGDLIIDQDEIEEGGWYTKDNLPGRPSVSVSIGSRMINHWLDCNKNE